MTEHMSMADYRKEVGISKPAAVSKYHNVKITIDGIEFDSKAEARRYTELKLLKQAGEIKGFGIQPSFVLPGGIRYRADFIVCDKGGLIRVEDVKGVCTKEFSLKQKLWKDSYPWLELRLMK